MRKRGNIEWRGIVNKFMKPLTLFFLLFASALQIFAVNFTVTRNDDRNLTCDSNVDCSLREAISAANQSASNDIINFATNLSLITLTDEISILDNGTLTISGNGANIFTINAGNGTNRAFYIFNTNVSILDATLTNGGGTGNGGSGVGSGVSLNGFGGAILTEGGSLILDKVHVIDNLASIGDGGGIYFSGGINRITNSTFSGNTASACGGGFTNGSGGGTVTVINSTVSGNNTVTNGVGGGFCNLGSIALRNVTVTNNTATAGGGIGQSGSLNFGNTIVAGNSATGSFPSEISFNNGTITSAGNNLIGDSAGDSENTGNSIAYQSTDILDAPPLLGELQYNGGGTPTHALLIGSPAIDTGNNTLTTELFDQRGVGFPRIKNSTVDIGAFEFSQITTVATVSISGRVLASRGRGVSGALVQIRNPNGEMVTTKTNYFGYYNFNDVASGETYIVEVGSKRFTFAPQIVNITEDLNDLNFSAL